MTKNLQQIEYKQIPEKGKEIDIANTKYYTKIILFNQVAPLQVNIMDSDGNMLSRSDNIDLRLNLTNPEDY